MRRVFRGLLLALAAAVPLRAATSETDRLVIVGKPWGEVQQVHPWVRYKPIDWDAALVRALPRLRAAATDDEFAAAIGEIPRRTRITDARPGHPWRGPGAPPGAAPVSAVSSCGCS